MKFEWNEEKAEKNLAKRGVASDEAKIVFEDSLYVDFYGPEHSDKEDRCFIVGK